MLYANASAVAAAASTATITFTEVPLPNLTPVTNQFAAYGINLQNAYLYLDARDTFDGVGVSILDTSPGIIVFTPADSLSIDFGVIGGFSGALGSYSVFDNMHNLLDSFTLDATGGDVLGAHMFTGSGIAQLEYSGSPGLTQVSTLRFNEVPEPCTLILMAAGLAAVVLSRARRAGRA